jgi:hypothetical protein
MANPEEMTNMIDAARVQWPSPNFNLPITF